MDPIERALLSLEGLSVGDAFGERFFGIDDHVAALVKRRAPPTERTWRYTDDTEIALVLVEHLARTGGVVQDDLANAFARRMDPARGYGAGAYRLLMHVRAGGHWRQTSRDNFRGSGSFGNGAAMRVAPLGAFFADDLERCIREAQLSAEVTHAHHEGIAGAIAVAAAAAVAWERRGSGLPLGREWLRRVRDVVPVGYVRAGIDEALGLPAGTSTHSASRALGNGAGVTAPDTVPFCLWVASCGSPQARGRAAPFGGHAPRPKAPRLNHRGGRYSYALATPRLAAQSQSDLDPAAGVDAPVRHGINGCSDGLAR
jgi:ADP-ribosylglycohydrolase